MINRDQPITIHQLMNKFEKSDFSLLDHVDDNVNLAIEHYQDDGDVSWQSCQSKQGLLGVLGRLSKEVFPKGTKILKLESEDLGKGWYTTRLSQTFWYGVMEQEVNGLSVIISHETDGVIDYFREIVQSVEPV